MAPRLLTLTWRRAYKAVMDRLDRMIADKQALVETLKKEIAERAERHERLLIELEMLKDAAKARPAPKPPKENTASPAKKARERNGKKGGRQAGDISLEWRRALKVLHLQRKRVSYLEIHKAAAEVGINTQMANVRERVRSMVENDLISGSPEQGFWVTKEAVARFGLDKTDDAKAA